MTVYVADDFPAIAKRMQELDLQHSPVRWGIWYTAESTWCSVLEDGFLRTSSSGHAPSSYTSEEEAKKAIEHSGGSAKVYLEAKKLT